MPEKRHNIREDLKYTNNKEKQGTVDGTLAYRWECSSGKDKSRDAGERNRNVGVKSAGGETHAEKELLKL